MALNYYNKYRAEIIAIGVIALFLIWGYLKYKPPGPVVENFVNVDSLKNNTKHLVYVKTDSLATVTSIKPKNGIIKTYDEFGKIEEIATYKNDILEGKYEYFIDNPNASQYYKSTEGYYLNGKKTGLWKIYDYYYDFRKKTFDNKLITVRIDTYKEGEFNGKCIEFDPKYGFKLIESNFINGKEYGIRKNYCPHGVDRGKLYYLNEVADGQIIKSYNYQCKCDQDTLEVY